MKANRIPKVDSTRTEPTDTRAYGGPQVAGIEFDEGYDALVLHLDSPQATTLRKLAFAGFRDIGAASSLATTINWAQAQHQELTLADGTNVLTFTGGVAGQTYKLGVKQTGSDLVTWPSSVKWSGGTAPTLTTTAGRTDVFEFLYDGTDYIGRTVGLNYTLS
jgi:hypothetical protein